jgi:hypothetical protein
MNELIFYLFFTDDAIDEARKILKRKIMSAFHGQIKLDPEDLVGLVTPTKKTF